MPDVLIRDIEPVVYAKLKARARQNARSMEAELRALLNQSVRESEWDAQAEVAKVRALFKGRHFSDSVEQIREDRAR